MEFNSPSTVNLVCLNIYNTVQLKIETSIYCVGGAPTRKSAAAAARRDRRRALIWGRSCEVTHSDHPIQKRRLPINIYLFVMPQP